MKMNNIMKGIAALTVAGSMASCSSNYLEQPPITLVSDDQITTSVEGARAALYGLCQAMYIGKYGDWLRISNGEGYFRTLYGDSGSPDFFDSWLAGSQSEFQIWALMTTDGNIANTFPWAYCYNLIFQANNILREIDSCPGDPDEVNFIKAQAKVMRAHAYYHLMQVYGPRFEDSKNGEALTVVLRKVPGSEDLPLSSYKVVMKFIYDELDEAIALFEGSEVERSYGFEPDIDVARAIYSRAALLNHDWEKAQKMAHDARADYPIMTAAEYKAGFGEHNGEWIWFNAPDKDYNGYNSWGASFSCNGAYAIAYNWSGAGCISYDFYKEMYAKYPNDVRLELFWTPDKANKYVDFGITDADFWDNTKVNSEFLFCYGMDEKMTAAVSLFISQNTPAGYTDGYSINTSLSLADAKNAVKRRKWFSENSIKGGGTDGRVQFGAQIKFWSDASSRGASELAFIRSGELILTEAEAAYENHDETTARNCLNELNAKRIPGYSANSLSGDALRDEIRMMRRLELWGEGDTWFSFKRWNLAIDRRIWISGDPSTNNFLPAYEGTWPATYNNGWRYHVPRQESNYNSLVVRDQDPNEATE